METTPEIWIAACAHELQQRWRTVDPGQLGEVATELWRDAELGNMTPAQAATQWLRPITNLNGSSVVRRASAAKTP